MGDRPRRENNIKVGLKKGVRMWIGSGKGSK
jgi:hypothetical protein